MSRRVPFVALVAALLLAPLAGCGVSQGGDTEPAAYAKAVCAGLLTWRQGISQDSTELTTALGAKAADVGTVRTRYTRFFASTVRRTDDLLTAVREAGAPKVDDGLGYAGDLTDALEKTRKGLAAAQTRFAALPADDLRSYAAGAAKIRDSLGTLFTAVGASLDQLDATYDDKTLDGAFRDDPGCKSLG